MARLTTAQRKALPKSAFAVPSKAPGPGSYPISDPEHARKALQLGARFASSGEKAAIRRKVAKKYPSVEISGPKSAHSKAVAGYMKQRKGGNY